MTFKPGERIHNRNGPHSLTWRRHDFYWGTVMWMIDDTSVRVQPDAPFTPDHDNEPVTWNVADIDSFYEPTEMESFSRPVVYPPNWSGVANL